MAEPLTDLVDTALPELDPDTPPAETDADAPSAPPDSSARLDALNARVEALAAQNATYEQRLRDTQAWGNQANQGAVIANALVGAMSQRDQALAQQQQYWAQMAPPGFDEAERESILTDPDVLQRKMQEFANYSYRVAHAQFAPVAQRAAAMENLLGPLLENTLNMSEQQAKEIAANQHGISADEYDELLPHARRIFEDMPDKWAAIRVRVQPHNVALAVSLARSKYGVPVKKSRPAASLGVGSHSPQSSSAQAPITRGEAVERMEKELGIKYTDADLRNINNRRSARR